MSWGGGEGLPLQLSRRAPRRRLYEEALRGGNARGGAPAQACKIPLGVCGCVGVCVCNRIPPYPLSTGGGKVEWLYGGRDRTPRRGYYFEDASDTGSDESDAESSDERNQPPTPGTAAPPLALPAHTHTHGSQRTPRTRKLVLLVNTVGPPRASPEPTPYSPVAPSTASPLHRQPQPLPH